MQFDRTRYTVWDKKHWVVMHYILNPGLAINELILGQRVPKILLIDKHSNKPLMERTFVPCPHCKTLHDGRTWSQQHKTAFKNWFGLYCPKCEGIIPCVRNWLSALIIFITYPLWFKKIDSWKTAWLNKQATRYQNINLDLVEHKVINWFKMGVAFGLIMFLITTPVFFFINDISFKLENMLFLFGISMTGGLLFGITMKLWMGRKTSIKSL